jgi:hypothetical protein
MLLIALTIDILSPRADIMPITRMFGLPFQTMALDVQLHYDRGSRLTLQEQ